MTSHGIGRQQRHILETMHRNNGVWPAHWKIPKPHGRDIFTTLQQRGLIRRAWVGRNYTYRLTRTAP